MTNKEPTDLIQWAMLAVMVAALALMAYAMFTDQEPASIRLDFNYKREVKKE